MTSDEDNSEFDDGFLGISKRELEGMSDAKLAQWQAGWKAGTEKHILAEKEWDRRIGIRQLREQFNLNLQLARANERAMRFAAIIGVLGTLAGAALGMYATFKTANNQTSHQASQSHTQPATALSIAPATNVPASGGATSK